MKVRHAYDSDRIAVPVSGWKKIHMHVMFTEVAISSIPQGVYCATLDNLKVYLWKLRLEVANVNC